MDFSYLFAGNIKTVQGFASRTVGRLNAKPNISEDEAVRVLRDQWNHTSPIAEVTVRLDDPKLQALDNVSVLVL